MQNSIELKKAALQQGFDFAGVCPATPAEHWDYYRDWIGAGNHAQMEYLVRHLELKQTPKSLLPEVKSILAVALNYYDGDQKRTGNGKVARYARGRDYHKVIRAKLRRVGKWAETTYPELKWRVCVDSSPIFEREYAHLAGLGWFGKNTCLINSHRGSWFLLGLLLLSQEFEPDVPAAGGCGNCTLCIDACPTGALEWKGGQVSVLNSSKCISYLTIEHSGDLPSETDLGGWAFGCDVCQEVCPFNQPRKSQPLRATVGNDWEFRSRRVPTNLDLDRILDLEDSNLREEYAGTALMRAVPDKLKRNANKLLQ